METASLQLPKDLIEAAIHQNVQKALAETFASNTQVISGIVNGVLNQKVDYELKPCSYSNSKPLIEQTLQNAMRELVKNIITEEVQNYKDVMRDHLLKELRKKNSPLIRDLVNGMTDGVISSMSNSWRLTVEMIKD